MFCLSRNSDFWIYPEQLYLVLWPQNRRNPYRKQGSVFVYFREIANRIVALAVNFELEMARARSLFLFLHSLTTPLYASKANVLTVSMSHALPPWVSSWRAAVWRRQRWKVDCGNLTVAPRVTSEEKRVPGHECDTFPGLDRSHCI